MSERKNLKGKRLVEQVEEEIFQMIKNTPVRVGEKLPNEYHFSELFCRKTIRLESGISKRKKQLKSRNTPVLSCRTTFEVL